MVKEYDGFVALKGVSFEVKAGELFGLLGPNGAGKTTLLRIIGGIIPASEGRVEVLGMDVSEKPYDVKRLIGFCPQEMAFYEDLSAWDNMLFYAGLYDIPSSEAKRRCRELLEMLGLWDVAKKKVGAFSGGMKKKLNLAISLINDPKLLLLDEPTTGLDPNARREFWRYLERLKEEGKTVLLATHYMEEADYLSDRVAIMNEGRIIALDTPQSLKEKYGGPSVIELEAKRITEEEAKTLSEFSEKRQYLLREGTLRLYVKKPRAALPKIAEKAISIGLDVVSIRVVEPTLEDVFLRLTGRRLEE